MIKFIFTSIAIVAMLVISSCQKNENIILKSSNMKQILYTEEGSKYQLKSVTTVFQAHPYTNVLPVVYGATFNYPAATSETILGINTANKVIPLSYSLSIRNAVALGFMFADITSPYFLIKSPINNSDLVGGLRPLSKLIPYIDKVFYTNDYFYGFNVRHNQVVFNDGDFIDVTSPTAFHFCNNLGSALTFYQDFITIPVDTYDITATFVYYEMIK